MNYESNLVDLGSQLTVDLTASVESLECIWFLFGARISNAISSSVINAHTVFTFTDITRELKKSKATASQHREDILVSFRKTGNVISLFVAMQCQHCFPLHCQH